MKLSIIIVNYNVRHFLEQCLHSVKKAIKNTEAEVFVVDNNSVDGSSKMVMEKFPEIHLIENDKNLGFSKANNQAIKKARGKYILLLNPDTVVEEDTFEKCLAFMDQHQEAGGLGVKMIDGKGNFLPESKRALPTPSVAFYKIFGLTRLFPKSKIFSKYHLGYLNKDEIHAIEILPGAFMMLRKAVTDEIGMLDESFFMYGEDIDLSYRIIKAGYKNYYYPEATIIHYKGESTKKGSINYVMMFYKAMIIFANKHFSRKNAAVFSVLINLAIYFRAFIAIIHRVFKALFFPLFDAMLTIGGYYFIIPQWEMFKFGSPDYYPDKLLFMIIPIYTFIWIMAVFFSGGYEKPVKISKHIKGVLLGTLIILVFYSLLPADYRFSRALILIGAIWVLLSTLGIRYLINALKMEGFELSSRKKKRIFVVGNKAECIRIKSIINQIDVKYEAIEFIRVTEQNDEDFFSGNIEDIHEMANIEKIDEIIFSGSDLPSREIINLMLNFADERIDFKIAPPESLSVIGSNSINTAGDFYIVNLNAISKPKNLRNKRFVDFFFSFTLLLLSPFYIFVFRNPSGFYKNMWNILSGKLSFVGYYLPEDALQEPIPKIKQGILNPMYGLVRKKNNQEMIEKINFIYAKDYKTFNDLLIIFRGFKQLDRKITMENS